MFQSLRPNSLIYILHKNDKLTLDKGSVVTVSLPTPKYSVSPTYNLMQEMIVDIVVKVDNQDVTYLKIPAQADIADFGNNSIVITDNKEAMNNELSSLKLKSEDVVKSIDYHKNRIKECDDILRNLNPEFAEKKQLQEEIESLKNQIKEMSKNMAELMKTNLVMIDKISNK